jgi:predicted CoA-binding protein
MHGTDETAEAQGGPGDAEPVPILDAAAAREVLRTARRIAVVGASPHEWRASHRVMAYLMAQGYECVPISPNAREVLGRPCYTSLETAVAAEGGSAFDIVDVFRRAEHTPAIARSAVALGCRTLWLQMGIASDEAARIAHRGGLTVVMDRCTAVDHRALREQLGGA